ncbi:nucleotidyltransferase domain-containing protein [Flavobacteriaceae bacterium Ap0902]|nr:nucleotidyltransferase domain-containing protein [Flavobacteriaceae bacterium Ap0902]
MDILSSHIDNIKTLCQKHKVAKLYLFGSATGSQFRDDSDIDFLVTFYPINLTEYFSNYISFKNSLRKILDRNIDLIETQTLKNPILIDSINKNKALVYGW